MKNYFIALALKASLICHANAAKKFEISEPEIKTILATKTYEFQDKGLYNLDEIDPSLEQQLSSTPGIKGEMTFDSNQPEILTLQCLQMDEKGLVYKQIGTPLSLILLPQPMFYGNMAWWI